jgi:hypothetical protein
MNTKPFNNNKHTGGPMLLQVSGDRATLIWTVHAAKLAL